MKTESLSLSERVQTFSRELALSLRRITGCAVELDLPPVVQPTDCLLYTSDAADERSSVDLGGRRIIKKKTHQYQYCDRHIISNNMISITSTTECTHLHQYI